jgi:uncharacterized membrane protein YagU involved in acid resistance
MDTKRAATAGLIGTATMTALLLVEPSIGLPKIAIGEMLSSSMSALSSQTSMGPAAGWVVDALVGIVFALIYAGVLDRRLPGTPVVRGLLFGVLVFILAQLIFAPLTGSGLFSSGDVVLLLGGLLGHLVYGSTVGYVYGGSGTSSTASAP